MSMFKQHVRNLLRVTTADHFRLAEENQKLRAEYETVLDSRRGCFASSCFSAWQSKSDPSKMDFMSGAGMSGNSFLGKNTNSKSRKSLKSLKREANTAIRAKFGLILQAV